MGMSIRCIINEDGFPFDFAELQTISRQLDSFCDDKRIVYRNQNAATIAKHSAAKILIISGPGTGKSHLFLDRINHWYQNNPEASVFVTSFVRKLVVDLQNDINNDEKISEEQKKRIMVSTLHGFARSIVEKNHGISDWQFRPYFRIIGQSWEKIVWADVLTHHPELDKKNYNWKKFEQQLHDNRFLDSEDWLKLKQTYCALCKFYNVAGFADLIIRARIALEENRDLNKDGFFIIDEYQDFNLAEEALILRLVNNAEGLLIAGDDEQVLYEKLKSGKAELIRSLYQNRDYINAMLPFSGRSGYHLVKSAAHFIQQHRDSNCIEKIYLPLKTNQDTPKVQVIACATPATAIDYIEKFVANNKTEIDERTKKLSEREVKDAFLLILTPARDVKFYGGKKDKLFQIISPYQTEGRRFSEDYDRILNYYSLANNTKNNFIFRKVLFYEGVSHKEVYGFIIKAIQNDSNFCETNLEEIREILEKCNCVKTIIDTEIPVSKKIDELTKFVSISEKENLKVELERQPINQNKITESEHDEEVDAELEETELKKMCAVELMTIVGSKGLSADHVIVIGFDDVNMGWVTKNAFYVAMTRARKSLHILTALRSGGATRAHNFLNQLPENHAEFYSYKKSGHIKTVLRGRQGFINYLNYVNSVSGRLR
jgi:superfamily I DNA/RNA helicase